VIELESHVIAYPISMNKSGIALDVQLDKEELLTKLHANHFLHVPDHLNILVSTIQFTVVYADTAHKDQDTSLELIDLAVTESQKCVTASQDSMRTSGHVSDAQLVKEEMLLKETVHHLLHVPDLPNTLVSMTLKIVVPVDIALMNQDGLLDQIDKDVTDQDNHVTAFQDSMK
jgi:hypothetical protein